MPLNIGFCVLINAELNCILVITGSEIIYNIVQLH